MDLTPAALSAACDAARAERAEEVRQFQKLAEQAVLALHLFERCDGRHVDDFERCKRGLCEKWNALAATEPSHG